MRWRLDYGTGDGHYVDADELRGGPYGSREFVRHTSDGAGFVVVCTIVSEMVPLIRITRVPTFRMVGGPKDGQVAAAPEKVPERIHFQPVVPLGENGETLAPMPPHEAQGLNDTYIHHPFACLCYRLPHGLVEHVYVWPETLHEQIAERGPTGPAQHD